MTQRLERFSRGSRRFSGRSLFHLHTDFTDGKLSVGQYFEFARKHGIERLIFLEHIRREPTYDVNRFAFEVSHYAGLYGIEGIVGFEAKLLPHGELDIRREHLEVADFIGIAEHAFPDDVNLLVQAFQSVLDLYVSEYPAKQFVWVHPGLWFKRRGSLNHPAYRQMLDLARRSPVWIERNLRYDLPSRQLVGYEPEHVVVGIDSHSAEDLHRYLEQGAS